MLERYTVKEAAAELRMSQAWIRQQIFSKKILYLKIGRKVFIPQSTIREILQRAIVEPKVQGNRNP